MHPSDDCINAVLSGYYSCVSSVESSSYLDLFLLFLSLLGTFFSFFGCFLDFIFSCSFLAFLRWLLASLMLSRIRILALFCLNFSFFSFYLFYCVVFIFGWLLTRLFYIFNFFAHFFLAFFCNFLFFEINLYLKFISKIQFNKKFKCVINKNYIISINKKV